MGASNISVIILAANGLVLILAFGLFLLALWLAPREPLNLFFGAFLFMNVFWTVGGLLSTGIAAIGGDAALTAFGLRILQVGFAGAVISLYLFTSVQVGVHSRFFLVISGVGLVVAVVYQVIALFGGAELVYHIEAGGNLVFDYNPFSVMVFLVVGATTAFLFWFQSRRIRGRGMRLGLLAFYAFQIVGLLNPRVRGLSIPVLGSGLAALILSLSLVRQQIIRPLVGRTSQLRLVRDVGLTITSRLRVDSVLASIAGQAAAMLEADAAAVYRLRGDLLEVVAVHNMPVQFLGYTLPYAEGVAGKAAQRGRPVCVDDYGLEWQSTPDLPLAKSTFGSVIAAPLVSGETTQGILLVVQGRRGKVFTREDERLLDLIGPQAAVAIANSELFEQQRDLTDALTDAKGQLEAVLSSTQSPVIAVNRQLTLVFTNPAAQTLLSHVDRRAGAAEDDTLIGPTRLPDLLPPNLFPDDIKVALRSLRISRTYVYEIDFEARTYLCHVAPLGEGRPQGWVAVLNDVTELKELDRFMGQMVRLTSHDLKNPLFAAMSYVELLDDELEDDTDVELLHSYTRTTMQQLDRMNRTISSILDLERLQSGSIAFEECRFGPVVEDVIDEFTPRADPETLYLEVELEPDLPVILGDPRQLRQVVANLIENALKFTPRGGGVLVEVKHADDGLQLMVRDTGVGIPAELHERVFERFFRGQQSGVEHVGGSGLGLSLVRDIVVAHQGRIWLESEPGVGTTVYVWLPAAEPLVS